MGSRRAAIHARHGDLPYAPSWLKGYITGFLIIRRGFSRCGAYRRYHTDLQGVHAPSALTARGAMCAFGAHK